MIETPRERDQRIQAELRAAALPAIIGALHQARAALNHAPPSIRHAARFHADLGVMIDAIEAQRHE